MEEFQHPLLDNVLYKQFYSSIMSYLAKHLQCISRPAFLEAATEEKSRITLLCPHLYNYVEEFSKFFDIAVIIVWVEVL